MLGGGVGGITAAFELTATPELRERFEVTVYQPGWRLGGKCASGRNAAQHDRIEEHGLHVWFGFYDNAFRLMRDAFDELARPSGAPLATFDEAFAPCDRIVLYDRQGEDWKAFGFSAPRNLGQPGVAGDLPGFWDVATTLCRWALQGWTELREDIDLDEPEPLFSAEWLVDLAGDLAREVLRVPLAGAEQLLELAGRLAGDHARRGDGVTPDQSDLFARLLCAFRDWLWSILAERCERNATVRLYFAMVDTAVSTLAGVLRDGVLEHGWDAINDEEWSAWLTKHGAKPVTIGATPAERSPVLRSVYDVAFGYPEGKIEAANLAAGTATNDLLRLIATYRGALMYKMQAGMGDVVFGPFYEVLARRGVRFEFFHAVTNLGLSAGNELIETIDLARQTEIIGDQYAPLIDVGGLPCWPSEPLWDQLRDGERLRAAGIDFERELVPAGATALRLERGVDFDEVVLGIAIGGLRPICSELIAADERFARAIDTAVTVQTQAFQLWLRGDAATLGWEQDEDCVVGCYVEPLDTYCDMTHLYGRESWLEEDGIGTIGYVCGVLDEHAGETQAEADERVRANAIDFIENDLQVLLPGAVGEAERFDSQYWRANIAASDRYVVTPAGTVKHRLRSDRSGFENLVLAGDWTRNGIDGGCVEAAAISGMQAARELVRRDPRLGDGEPILGEQPTWLSPPKARLPEYVEYGGRATSPGPFLSLDGRLRGLLLEGDGRRISGLIRRTLSDPAGNWVDYRAVGSKVLLLVGGFDRVSSLAPLFDQWGTVREIQASFWVPVLAGRDLGSVFRAERFCLAVPYIFVDNPMSYLGGHEAYGYAKTMGRFDPEDALGPLTRIDTFGGRFSTESRASWTRFMEISASAPAEPAEGPPPFGARELLDLALGSTLLPNAEGEVVLPGLELTATLVEDLLEGRMRQVFLKQFRDAGDGTRACYQSVVEAPIEVKHSVMRRSGRKWEVSFARLDSHPIEAELGISDQRAQLVFDGELDMVVQTGVEIGRIAGPTPADALPTTEPPREPGLLSGAVEGALGLAGGIARRLRGAIRPG